ncbi:prepilin peptidase [Hyphomonas sp. WL0036]|uniref:A24 family peptidase n=1 Tax=Hyphomonas sediminis TaxID=2866160 RepID=UPI001C7E4635|nr:prepilin peptidase [Hyphomonas sediminis]MBY9066539.1 prepilin peptidase [Hyphomonas sediminis]
MVLMFLGAIFLGLCVLAALFDVNQLKIPNWLNLTLAALFVPAAAVSGLPLEIIGGHLMAGALAFLISFGLFAFRIFGGGDAKMIPAVVLWVGPAAALMFTFKMAIVGGICAVLVLAVRRTAPAEAIPGFMRAPFEPNAGVPYGVAIAAGALLAGAGSPLLADLFLAAGFTG